jgi:putative redox protein
LKITLLNDARIRLEPLAGALTIEAESPTMAYSPFHMVASGLATCIFSVLASWAETTGVPVDELSVEVGWRFADGPHRVGAYDVALTWPSLPENRRPAARRVAGLCPIHATLHHPPVIEVQVAP